MTCYGIETFGVKGCWIMQNGACCLLSESGCKLLVDTFGNFHHAEKLTGTEELDKERGIK